MNGAWRYIPRGTFLDGQPEADTLLSTLPAVDILVSHNFPAGFTVETTASTSGSRPREVFQQSAAGGDEARAPEERDAYRTSPVSQVKDRATSRLVTILQQAARSKGSHADGSSPDERWFACTPQMGVWQWPARSVPGWRHRARSR